MKIGISLACFYPIEPENAVALAAEAGAEICEIFLNTFSELELEYLYALRDKCDSAGLKVYSVHPFTSAIENYFFFSPYPRRIEDASELYRKYAEAAKILGAEVINIHGDRGLGLESLMDYVECVKPLMKLQDETGIVYSMENVFYNSVNHPEFTVRLRQVLPDIRFTLDIKQAFKGGQDAYELAQAMGNAIANFHLNDRDETHICCLPGRGNVNYSKLGAILSASGYGGPGLIEVYSRDFSSVSEIEESKTFLESKFSLAN